jgi:hypothetical protein
MFPLLSIVLAKQIGRGATAYLIKLSIIALSLTDSKVMVSKEELIFVDL